MRLVEFGRSPHFLALLALVLPFSRSFDTAAAAETIHTDYSVTVRGFPVGRAAMQATVENGRYSIQFTGGIRGIARLFSDAETSAAAVGEVDDDRLRPDEYKHLWREDNKTEAVDMLFSGRRLTEVALDPPQRHPDHYVPLTDANRADVLDPVSAFVWPAASGVTPGICARTLPLMDGKRRFDIVFEFNRMEKFATSDRSYSDSAVVCSFRYRQVAGHRIGRSDDTAMTDSDGMEAWMAPAGDGLVALARLQFQSRLGRVVLTATKITAER